MSYITHVQHDFWQGKCRERMSIDAFPFRILHWLDIQKLSDSFSQSRFSDSLSSVMKKQMFLLLKKIKICRKAERGQWPFLRSQGGFW
jgi:hypothetical protein